MSLFMQEEARSTDSDRDPAPAAANGWIISYYSTTGRNRWCLLEVMAQTDEDRDERIRMLEREQCHLLGVRKFGSSYVAGNQ
jgi:hypothetical protein